MVGEAVAATVRAHANLDSCVFTVGNWCPVESLGLTLVGALVLGVIALLFGGVLAWLKRRAISLSDWVAGPTVYDDDKRQQ